MYTESDLKSRIEWDDSKTIPHWELSLDKYTLSCDMTDDDYQTTVKELLALANNE